MSDPKQARVLLEAAERDASALRGMGDAAVFADEVFGFHAQQAAEKLFKAWLALLGETYPMTHDLSELLELLRRSVPLRRRRRGSRVARPQRGPRAGGSVARSGPPTADGRGRGLTTVDLNVKVPALEKLVDYTASGIGAVAGPMLAPWKARKEAEARLIEARADADSLKLIADAQAKARNSLVESDEAGRGVLEIDQDGIRQRIEFQERKRQANIASVVRDAAAELGDKEVPDREPDHDWTARFFRRRSGRFIGGYAKALGENPVGRSRGTGPDDVADAGHSQEHDEGGCPSIPGHMQLRHRRFRVLSSRVSNGASEIVFQ